MPRVEIGSYESKVKEYNRQSLREIAEKHSRLNFKDTDDGNKYVQCQNEKCGRWVRCHWPQRSPEGLEIRRILDIVPLYNFGGTDLLHCGECFSKYYSKKYF
jgi:hypothetical protein